MSTYTLYLPSSSGSPLMSHRWKNSNGDDISGPLNANVGDTIRFVFHAPKNTTWQSVEIQLQVTNNGGKPSTKFDGATYNGTPDPDKPYERVLWTTDLTSITNGTTKFIVNVLFVAKGKNGIIYYDPDPEMIVGGTG